MTFTDISDAYKLYGYEQARQEGKLGQWFVRQLMGTCVKIIFRVLWCLVKVAFNLAVYPIAFCWRYNQARTSGKIECLFKTLFYSIIAYFFIIAAILTLICDK